jgi:hypothetical protein
MLIINMQTDRCTEGSPGTDESTTELIALSCAEDIEDLLSTARTILGSSGMDPFESIDTLDGFFEVLLEGENKLPTLDQSTLLTVLCRY